MTDGKVSPAQTSNQPVNPANNGVSPQSTGGGGQPQTPISVHREQEVIPSAEVAPISEVLPDVEIAPELESIGLEKRSETIDLPPDMKKMGVTAVGAAQPVFDDTQTISLPLTDDQIIVGLHAQIVSSLRWLAEWCIRQLKRAHVKLKTVHGKIIREKS